MFLSSTYLERSSWLWTVYGSIENINLSEMVVGFKLACDFQKERCQINSRHCVTFGGIIPLSVHTKSVNRTFDM